MWLPQLEYNEVKKKLPIPCVDLIVRNNEGEILLVKRKNEPAGGEWWFPGGRVQYGETRSAAAERKLKEECGLMPGILIEWKTFDIFLPDVHENYISHAISTFFIFPVASKNIRLDSQSIDLDWKTPQAWLPFVNSKLVKEILNNNAILNLI